MSEELVLVQLLFLFSTYFISLPLITTGLALSSVGRMRPTV